MPRTIVGGVPLLVLDAHVLGLAPLPDILRPVKLEVVALDFRRSVRSGLLWVEDLE